MKFQEKYRTMLFFLKLTEKILNDVNKLKLLKMHTFFIGIIHIYFEISPYDN